MDDNQIIISTIVRKDDLGEKGLVILLRVTCLLEFLNQHSMRTYPYPLLEERGSRKSAMYSDAILDLMGEIKDGTVSGFFPSTKAFIVHYPGYPSSTSRAVETLGGYEGILKARSSDSNKLELRFRPKDPFCHPASGELHHCNNFLLKISRKSKSFTIVLASQSHNDISNFQIEQPGEQPPDSVASVAEYQTQICANITAHVSEAYHFTGMADYQHVVAVHADIVRKKKRKGKEPGQHSFEKKGPSSFDGEDVMMLVPPLFSPKDAPTTVVLSYQPNMSSSRRKLDVDDMLNEVLMERSLALDFKVKEIPSKVAWEEHMPQGSEDWEKQMAWAKLFDEQPIWPKRSLNEKLLAMGFNLGSLMPKRLLINVAYYFNNGPFLKFWIRKGYDPRKDPESRIYQGIDFRVPQQLQSYCEPAETTKSDCRWEDICTFRIFPWKCHLSLQLFELSDDYIQQEIRNSPLQQSCTFKNGWFVDHVLDTIRQQAMMRFLSVYPQPGAEGFLKQASERFEKLKRIRLRDSPLKEQKIQQDIEDTQEEEELEDIESENDFEGGEIAENGEEEMDAYDVLDQEAEAGDTLQLNSYTEVENISRTYLQELFGSFPAPEGDGPGHDMQNLDEDDGEYEIYEQHSEDGYSDEY